MAVIYKSGSKKMLALGNVTVSVNNHAVPGLLVNKHVSLTIPIDEKKYMIIRLTFNEFDEMVKTVNIHRNELS